MSASFNAGCPRPEVVIIDRESGRNLILRELPHDRDDPLRMTHALMLPNGALPSDEYCVLYPSVFRSNRVFEEGVYQLVSRYRVPRDASELSFQAMLDIAAIVDPDNTYVLASPAMRRIHRHQHALAYYTVRRNAIETMDRLNKKPLADRVHGLHCDMVTDGLTEDEIELAFQLLSSRKVPRAVVLETVRTILEG